MSECISKIFWNKIWIITNGFIRFEKPRVLFILYSQSVVKIDIFVDCVVALIKSEVKVEWEVEVWGSLRPCSVVIFVVEGDDNEDGKVECCGVDVDLHLKEQGQIIGIGSAACTSFE